MWVNATEVSCAYVAHIKYCYVDQVLILIQCKLCFWVSLLFNMNPNQHIKTRSYANKQKNRRSSRFFSRLPWLDKHQLLSCLYKQICCVSWCVWGWWLKCSMFHLQRITRVPRIVWTAPIYDSYQTYWAVYENVCRQTPFSIPAASGYCQMSDIVCILLQMCCRTSGWRLDRLTERDAKQLKAKLKSQIPWFKWNSLSFFCDWSFS